MSDYLFNMSQPHDILRQLRICNHNLLIAYDAPLNNDLWIAFEKAFRVCEELPHRLQLNLPKTIH